MLSASEESQQSGGRHVQMRLYSAKIPVQKKRARQGAAYQICPSCPQSKAEDAGADNDQSPVGLESKLGTRVIPERSSAAR
jgi:hypothetical protein